MTKLDPRVEPTSIPPGAAQDFSIDRVAVPRQVSIGAKPVAENHPVSSQETAAETRSEAKASHSVQQITNQDPRIEALEKLLDGNDWQGIGKELGSLDDVGKLPPNLGLIAALAHNEAQEAGHSEASEIAIRCMAALLGVSESSSVARVLARRVLRKNPVRLMDRKAPPARVSILIVVLTLLAGGGVGWLASSGSIRGLLQLLHLG